MWDQHNDTYKTCRLNRDASLSVIQSTFDELVEQSASFGESVYLGGQSAVGKAACYVHVTPLHSPAHRAQEVLETCYVDQSGLFSNVAVVEQPTPTSAG